MTKPRVISKDAIRRAKRKGVTYIVDHNCEFVDLNNYAVVVSIRSVLCGVYMHRRTDAYYGTDEEYRVMPIGRGGNRNGYIDWAAAGDEDYENQVRRDYWADQF